MSFSGDLRAELARTIPSGRRDRETAIAALLINICRISGAENGAVRLHFSTGNLPALRKCFTMIQKTVNISSDLFAPLLSADGKKADGRGRGAESSEAPDGAHTEAADRTDKVYEVYAGSADRQDSLAAGPQLLELLTALSFLDRKGRIRPQDGTLEPALLKGERNRSYLREMFLCTGFMNDPGQRYHLEFRCCSQPQADQLTGVLDNHGIRAGLTHRKSYFVVYIKDSDDIVMLLHLMDASVSLMATENARILKEVRNTVNRRVNCETANIGKTVRSAGRQIGDIALLRERGILQSLPDVLREAAVLREEHPGASLTELGSLAVPPVGRSGMNHRLRKLSALAQKAREENGRG